MSIEDKLTALCCLVERQQRERFASDYPGPYLEDRMTQACATRFTVGKKWARVDVGTSGKYMVDLSTQEIVGIKAYGVPHSGHRYGTLDTMEGWNWGGYVAHPIKSTEVAQ